MITSVLIVLKHLNFGGTERYAANLTKALDKLGVSVVIVADKGPYGPYLLKSNHKVVYAPINGKGPDRLISEKIILKAAKKYKVQVIHAQCRNSVKCSQLARKVLSIPVVCHEHLSYRDKDYLLVAKELNKFADKVITVGLTCAEKLIESGLESSKVRTVFNGIALSEFPRIGASERTEARKGLGLKEKDKVILCLSRIVPGKEIEVLVDAFAIISSKFPNVKLLIAGDDEWNRTKPAIERKISEQALSGKVTLFPGQFDIRKFHCAADVFCYPAISKGMAVMEAMASSLPVVAKVPSRKPYVVRNNDSGYLTRSSDCRELASKLKTILSNKGIARTMGRNGRRTIEKDFNLNKSVFSVVKTYNEAVSSYPYAIT